MPAVSKGRPRRRQPASATEGGSRLGSRILYGFLGSCLGYWQATALEARISARRKKLSKHSANGAFTGEPNGFFGLSFGEPPPREVILSPGSERYKAAFDKLQKEDQWIVNTALASDFLDAIQINLSGPVVQALRDEFKGERGTVLVQPPSPNRLFDVYVALVTPETGVVAGIWTYWAEGALDPTKPVISALAEHLLSKYGKLHSRPELLPLPLRLRDDVWLESKRVAILISRKGFSAANRKLEWQFKDELVRVGDRIRSSVLENEKTRANRELTETLSKLDESGL